MVTKKRYVMSLTLRNSVLNNLIHSHGFDYPYKPTTPSALSPSQIFPWRSTYGLLLGCFHLHISSLTGLKVSSPASPHPASGPCKWHVGPPHHPGQGLGMLPFPLLFPLQGISKTSHISTFSSPSLQTQPQLGPSLQGLLGDNSLPPGLLGFGFFFLPIFHAVTKWPPSKMQV